MKKNFLCFLLLIGLSTHVFGKNFHILIISNTSGFSKENTIHADGKLALKECKKIAHTLNYTPLVTVLNQDSLSVAAIQNWTETLPQNSSDIVVVHYAGHGGSDRRGKKWPIFKIGPAQEGIAASALIESVQRKNCRFALLLFDSCNSPLINPPPHIIRFFENNQIARNLATQNNIKRLFLDKKLCIAMTSSSYGQSSFGDDSGGYFTECFFTQLTLSMHVPKIRWKDILQRAQKCTIKKTNHVQTPVYEIFELH